MPPARVEMRGRDHTTVDVVAVDDTEITLAKMEASQCAEGPWKSTFVQVLKALVPNVADT